MTDIDMGLVNLTETARNTPVSTQTFWTMLKNMPTEILQI